MSATTMSVHVPPVATVLRSSPNQSDDSDTDTDNEPTSGGQLPNLESTPQQPLSPTATHTIPPTPNSTHAATATTTVDFPTSFWFMFSLICLVLFLAESSRGIVIPTLTKYVDYLGGSSMYLGFLIATFSVGRLVSSYLLGLYLTVATQQSLKSAHPVFFKNQRIVTCLILSSCLVIIGHLLYILAGSLGGLVILVFARFLVGFGTGVLTLGRTYVGESVPSSKKSRFMSWLGIVQFLGFAFTPILGSLSFDTFVGYIHITSFNFGAFLLASATLLSVLSLIGIQIIWRRREHALEAQRKHVQMHQIGTSKIDADQDESEASLQTISHSSIVASKPTSNTMQQPLLSDYDQDLSRDSSTYSDARTKVQPDFSTTNSPHGLSSFSSSTESAIFEANGVNAPAHGFSTDGSVRISFTDESTRDAALNDKVGFGSASSSTIPSSEAVVDVSSTHIIAPVQTNRLRSTVHLLWLLVLGNLIVRGSLSIAETYGAVLYYNIITPGDSDQVTDASVFFLGLGCGGVAIFLLVEYLHRWFSIHWLMFWSFGVGILGYILLVDFDNDLQSTAFIPGMILVWSISSPIVQTTITTELSNSLTTATTTLPQTPTLSQGLWMGYLTAAGSIGRILFPLVGSAVYRPGSSGIMLLAAISHSLFLIGYLYLNRDVFRADLYRWKQKILPQAVMSLN